MSRVTYEQWLSFKLPTDKKKVLILKLTSIRGDNDHKVVAAQGSVSVNCFQCVSKGGTTTGAYQLTEFDRTHLHAMKQADEHQETGNE